MHVKKHLNFDALRKSLSSNLYDLVDSRHTGKVEYRLHDLAMSGFACMFLQSPSLLEYQRKMENTTHRNNLMTQFNIQKTPGDTAIREGIDNLASETFTPVFKDYLTRLQRSKRLQAMEFISGYYLLPLDGSQFYVSDSINCDTCLIKKTRGGKEIYAHQVVQSAIVHPNFKAAFPMMPEQISNADGNTKQDCKINAAKRMMPKIKKGLTLNRHDEVDEKGKKKIYEWKNDIQVFKGNESLRLNYIQFRIVTPSKNKKVKKSENEKDKEKNKVTYVGNWITDLPLNEDNIVNMVKAARCKWRIENECFNTLKNQGYYIDHNFGHGKNNLCFNFYILTLLAFYMHQIFELTDVLYKKLRAQVGTLKNVWVTLRVLFNRYVYSSWNEMLEDAIEPHEFIRPHPPPNN